MRGRNPYTGSGLPPQKRVVIEYLRDPEVWKRQVGHGLRWMVEAEFSVLKRLSGEHVLARTLSNMVGELRP